MGADVKVTISVPQLDALRRIIARDMEVDNKFHQEIEGLAANDPVRFNGYRDIQRRQYERETLERAFGIDATKDEIGRERK